MLDITFFSYTIYRHTKNKEIIVGTLFITLQILFPAFFYPLRGVCCCKVSWGVRKRQLCKMERYDGIMLCRTQEVGGECGGGRNQNIPEKEPGMGE